MSGEKVDIFNLNLLSSHTDDGIICVKGGIEFKLITKSIGFPLWVRTLLHPDQVVTVSLSGGSWWRVV